MGPNGRRSNLVRGHTAVVPEPWALGEGLNRAFSSSLTLNNITPGRVGRTSLDNYEYLVSTLVARAPIVGHQRVCGCLLCRCELADWLTDLDQLAAAMLTHMS